MEKYEIITTDEIQVSITPGTYYPKSKHHKRSDRNRIDRVVSKLGDFNIELSTLHSKCVNLQFTKNFFLTLVLERWRWTIFYIFIIYLVLWIFFAFIYWTISYHHGDLDFNHSMNATDFHNPCIKGIYGFSSTLLLSSEVFTKLTFGRRSITSACPEAIAAMCLQCFCSSLFQAVMVGILFARLTKPKVRNQTILFSNQAVIGMRDRKMCLTFRVGNTRKSRYMKTKISAFVIRSKMDVLQLDESKQIKLETEIDGCESTFFLWPLAVTHIIDKDSPLYHLSAVDLLCGKLEILVVFEGIIESTGQPVQARSSYTERELLWGHRFQPMLQFANRKDFFVDYSKLSLTEEIDNPLCSASEYETYVSQVFSSDIMR